MRGGVITDTDFESLSMNEFVAYVDNLGQSGYRTDCNWISVDFTDGSDMDVYSPNQSDEREMEILSDDIDYIINNYDIEILDKMMSEITETTSRERAVELFNCGYLTINEVEGRDVLYYLDENIEKAIWLESGEWLTDEELEKIY